MLQLRKKNIRSIGNIYQYRPIIRVTNASKARFIVSQLIIDALKINTQTEGVMFGIKDKKLQIFKEPKEVDNYHLAKCDTYSYRFRSIELYDYVGNLFKIPKDQGFQLEMQKDNFLKLV